METRYEQLGDTNRETHIYYDSIKQQTRYASHLKIKTPCMEFNRGYSLLEDSVRDCWESKLYYDKDGRCTKIEKNNCLKSRFETITIEHDSIGNEVKRVSHYHDSSFNYSFKTVAINQYLDSGRVAHSWAYDKNGLHGESVFDYHIDSSITEFAYNYQPNTCDTNLTIIQRSTNFNAYSMKTYINGGFNNGVIFEYFRPHVLSRKIGRGMDGREIIWEDNKYVFYRKRKCY